WRHQHDTVPEANVLRALRAGGEEHLRCRGMGVLLEEMVLDLPGEVDAEPVGELDLVERLLEEPEFVAVMPRPGELVLVKDAEFHGLAFRRSDGVRFLCNRAHFEESHNFRASLAPPGALSVPKDISGCRRAPE